MCDLLDTNTRTVSARALVEGFKFVRLDPKLPAGAKFKKTICCILTIEFDLSNCVSFLHSIVELPDICYKVSVVFPKFILSASCFIVNSLNSQQFAMVTVN
jgi:hypothetical protein